VRLGDDGLPLVITRDNISTWFEQNEIPMPENSDGLSDAELILTFADPLKAKSCYRVISYADALYFSHKDALEVLKGLDLKDWTHNGCFSHYPDELRNILMEFALGRTNSNETLDPAALLRQAIRERDEEIAKKKAEEEVRAESERRAAEAAERARQEAKDKIEAFLVGIEDFVLESGISIKGCWRPAPVGFTLSRAAFATRCDILNIEDGFDANVKKIIQWAVENGAREPELNDAA